MRKKLLWLGMFFAATLIVAGLFTFQMVWRYWEDLSNKTIPLSGWAEWIGVSLLDFSRYGLPLGVFAAAVFGLLRWRDQEGRIDRKRLLRIALIGSAAAIASFILVAELIPRSRLTQMALLWDFTSAKPGEAPDHVDPALFRGHHFVSAFSELAPIIDSLKAQDETRRQETLENFLMSITPEMLDSIRMDTSFVMFGVPLAELAPAGSASGHHPWAISKVKIALERSQWDLEMRREDLSKFERKRSEMLRYPLIILAAYMLGAGLAFLVHGRRRAPAPH